MTEQVNNAANEQPQFALQRIYVRDLSFEAPKTPEVFRQEWQPSVNVDLNTRQRDLGGDRSRHRCGIGDQGDGL